MLVDSTSFANNRDNGGSSYFDGRHQRRSRSLIATPRLLDRGIKRTDRIRPIKFSRASSRSKWLRYNIYWEISESYIVNIMKNWLICASTRTFPPKINRKRSHRKTSFRNDASSRTSCHSHLQLSVQDVPKAFNISPPVFLFLFFPREILALILPSFFHWEPLFQVESTYSGHNSRARVSALHFCHPALINTRDEARKRSSSPTKGEGR